MLDCHCLTYNENEKESQAEIGSCINYHCIYRSGFIDSVYNTLPENTLKWYVKKSFSEIAHSVVNAKMDISHKHIHSI